MLLRECWRYHVLARGERQKIDLEMYIVRKIKWEEENQKKRRTTKREGRR